MEWVAGIKKINAGVMSTLNHAKNTKEYLISNGLTRGKKAAKIVKNGMRHGDMLLIAIIKKRGTDMTYPDLFEQIWLLKPHRTGNNPKRKAYHAYNARIKEGYEHKDILEGLKRYTAFCEVSGTIGTPYIMHMSTFLGLDENFLEDWEPPKSEIVESIEQKGTRLGITAKIGESMDAYKQRIAQAR